MSEKSFWAKLLEVLKHIGVIVGMIILIAIAIGLVILIIPIAVIWKIIVSITSENRKGRDIAKGTAEFFFAIAKSIDKFGNVAFGGFFTHVLLINKVHRFGDTSETVSEVLGWAHKYDDLTKSGDLLRTFVNFADWPEEDHCEAARLFAVRKAHEKVEAARKFDYQMKMLNHKIN